MAGLAREVGDRELGIWSCFILDEEMMVHAPREG